MNAVQKVISDP